GSSAPVGYGVSESLQVTLRHLSLAGTQISDAVRAGGNAAVVEGVSLDLTDNGSLLASARAKAMADAKTKAGQYASALGRTLGPVVSVSESQPSAPIPPYGPAYPEAARLAPVPVHPGSRQLTVTVTAVFTLS
ncbi:MAG TPA: SIMPL domain-containing protein, partial [Streptosporangiaceae bacterium]